MKAQESLADFPSMLKERIETIKYYLEDVGRGLDGILEARRKGDDEDASSEEGEVDEESGVANSIISALRDLEFQLSDVDMARDFHTLGGWSYLVALLDDDMHYDTRGTTTDEEEEWLVIVDEIQALAAMTIGTAVGNLDEFHAWALEDVSTTVNIFLRRNGDYERAKEGVSVLSLLISSFERELSQRSEQMNGSTMAVLPLSSNARYKSRGTYKLRAIYALGSLLRGNPTAQRYFVSNGGSEIIIRNVLGTLSSVRGPEGTTNDERAMTKLDYKFASKVLALGEDVVVDVALHQDDYVIQNEVTSEGILSANQLVAAFTTERWCDLSLRMLSPPVEVLGDTGSRGIKERALQSVRALAPGCIELSQQPSWGVEEVKRVRSEWNREGSDDGLDSVYRRELLELVDGVLGVLQQ
mgnify:CR=1 FL=1